jgi:Bacterial Ig-like domain
LQAVLNRWNNQYHHMCILEISTTRMQIQPYTIRLLACSALLAIATIAVIAFAPEVPEITLTAQPMGGNTSRTDPLRITFSRAVDKRSAERAFVLYPPTPGRFVWLDEQTVEFQLAQPLQAETIYNITIRPGIRDIRGRENRFPSSGSFRTMP